MKEKMKKWIAAFFGAAAALLAGCVLWQKFCFWRAQKKYTSSTNEVYLSSQGKMAYFSCGRGRPLLLLHSMFPGTSHEEWEKLVDELALSFHVYALDFPGFGASFRPKEPWTAYQYAKCLLEFSENVIKRPCCILGANGGGDVALSFAKLYPQWVKKIILVSPEGMQYGFANKMDVKNRKRFLPPVVGTQRFLLASSKHSMKQALEELFFAKEKIGKDMGNRFSYASRFGKNAKESFAAIEAGFWRGNSKEALGAYPGRVMILWGEENKVNPISYMEEAQNICPRGEFVIFEETGAFPHLENSGAFAETVIEFLNQKENAL